MKILKFLSNKITILFLFLIFLGFNTYFSIQLQELNKIAEQEVKILDLRFGYSLEEVNLFFKHIGNDGKLLYKKISFADMLYPVFYGLLILSLLTFLAKENKKLYALFLFPILAVVIDFMENKSILNLMYDFSSKKAEMVAYSSALTQSKWIFVSLSILSILILFIRNFNLKKNKD